jgi:hypothetical protein
MRWVIVLVVATGCAKGLGDLYPFRCSNDMQCPLRGGGCAAEIGCTLNCMVDSQCIGDDLQPRDDLACVEGLCEQSCTGADGKQDPGQCADTYTCTENTSSAGKGLFTCHEL